MPRCDRYFSFSLTSFPFSPDTWRPLPFPSRSAAEVPCSMSFSIFHLLCIPLSLNTCHLHLLLLLLIFLSKNLFPPSISNYFTYLLAFLQPPFLYSFPATLPFLYHSQSYLFNYLTLYVYSPSSLSTQWYFCSLRLTLSIQRLARITIYWERRKRKREKKITDNREQRDEKQQWVETKNSLRWKIRHCKYEKRACRWNAVKGKKECEPGK